MLGAVEGHVFNKMGDALLVVFLVNRAGLHREPDKQPVRRLPVLKKLPGQAVLQAPAKNFGMRGKGRRTVA